MTNMFKEWYQRYFSDPEAIILLLTLVVFILLFQFFGGMLAPVFVSIAIAYLLDGAVKRLQRWKFPHTFAVSLVCILFIGLILIGIFWLLPLLWAQLTNLFNELPNAINRGQTLVAQLPAKYPSFISVDQINSFMGTLKTEFGNLGKVIISFSLASIPSAIEILVYAILVPLLVFFFLKDKVLILNWLSDFMPRKRQTLGKLWTEVNDQIGNYIRGRILEVIIVTAVCAITFSLMGLNYAILLAALVGISAIVPYIGAIVSTIPLVIIAAFQWGWSAQFAYLLIAYTIISLLDSNILVPLLFSETMDLHPVAIIVAVIVFGSVWGFWGVFFAIPLATVVKAVITLWPRTKVKTRTPVIE